MEKLIYVHIARLGKSKDDRFLGSGNDWYLIKQGEGGDGVELTRAFEDISQPKPCSVALLDTACQVIGSRIYVIGGSSIRRISAGYFFDEGSNMIYFLDTHKPKDGWRTCYSFPFIHCDGVSTVVDDQWLYVLGGSHENNSRRVDLWGFAVNVDGSREVKLITPPADLDGFPVISTCLSPGKLVVCMFSNGSLYELDCKNSTWTAYQEKLPYDAAWVTDCATVVDDGILYIYDSFFLKFTSYDIRNRRELYAVGIPRSNKFAYDNLVQLIVLSKNRFCIVWERRGGYNKLLICYSRFSVSFELGEPTIDLEENQAFPVAGYSLLNAVGVDPISDEANSSSVNSNAVHE